MSKSVLMSIQPKWCKMIESGRKTMELRKKRPKLKTPFKCYIYETKADGNFVARAYGYKIWQGIGKVIGEYVCDNIEDFSAWEDDYPSLLRHIDLYAGTNGDYQFLDNYLKGQKSGYGWYISDVVIYDEPKELSEFLKYNRTDCYFSDLGYTKPSNCGDCMKCVLKHPPQSWCYVEEMQY